MAQINPYIGFNGKCAEAMKFYKDCFGGELDIRLLKDSPMGCPTGMEDGVLHAELKGDIILMGTDMTGPQGHQVGNNIAISVNCNSEEEIRRLEQKLAEGGTVVDTVKPQFWGALFGMVADRYGIAWMLNYQLPQSN